MSEQASTEQILTAATELMDTFRDFWPAFPFAAKVSDRVKSPAELQTFVNDVLVWLVARADAERFAYLAVLHLVSRPADRIAETVELACEQIRSAALSTMGELLDSL